MTHYDTRVTRGNNYVRLPSTDGQESTQSERLGLHNSRPSSTIHRMPSFATHRSSTQHTRASPRISYQVPGIVYQVPLSNTLRRSHGNYSSIISWRDKCEYQYSYNCGSVIIIPPAGKPPSKTAVILRCRLPTPPLHPALVVCAGASRNDIAAAAMGGHTQKGLEYMPHLSTLGYTPISWQSETDVERWRFDRKDEVGSVFTTAAHSV